MVRAKFRCTSVLHADPGGNAGASLVTVNLSAAVEGDANKQWAKWTPSGKLELTITNPAAADYFKAGDDYYLDFRAAKDLS